MNEKNETPTMYPMESIVLLDSLYCELTSPTFKSKDQLDRVLRDMKPAFDAWFKGKNYCEEDIFILLYKPFDLRLYKYVVYSHIIPIVSENHRYDFQEIIRQLNSPPNVDLTSEELKSDEELANSEPIGWLRIQMLPYWVWETLSSNEPALPLEDIHENILHTALYVIYWLQVHPFPEGWEWYAQL